VADSRAMERDVDTEGSPHRGKRYCLRSADRECVQDLELIPPDGPFKTADAIYRQLIYRRAAEDGADFWTRDI